MGTTLQHGIFLPAEGERNCYTGLASNWTILDGMIGGYSAHAANLTIHVTAADKEAWNGKADASALTAHTGDATIHVTAADKEAWNGKADASALTAHTANTTIHVTAEDKEAWDGKADASALTAHTGNTTIHVTAADKQAWNGHIADSVKHVTAEDKAKWDAVTSKADDSDVVHKSGDETVTGTKTIKGVDLKFESRTGEYGVTGGNASLNFYDKNSLLLSYIKQGVTRSGISYQTFYILGYNSNNQQVNKSISFSSSNLDLSTVFLKPDTDKAIALGRSNAKWSDVQTYKVNGVEPSSLGMPDLDNGIDISSYIDVSQTSEYTASSNGYISICGTASVTNAIAVKDKNYDYAVTNRSLVISSVATTYVLIPVLANHTYQIICSAVTSIVYAKFYPCQGNV